MPQPAGGVDQPTGDRAPRPEPGYERAGLRVSDGQRSGETPAFMMDRQDPVPMVGQAGDAKDAGLPRLPPAFTDQIGRGRAADGRTCERLSARIEDPDDRLESLALFR